MDLPVGSPIFPVKSPMMITMRCPRSWICFSFRRTTAWPKWMSGALGSRPSFTVRGTDSREVTYSIPGAALYVLLPDMEDVAEAKELLETVLEGDTDT